MEDPRKHDGFEMEKDVSSLRDFRDDMILDACNIMGEIERKVSHFATDGMTIQDLHNLQEYTCIAFSKLKLSHTAFKRRDMTYRANDYAYIFREDPNSTDSLENVGYKRMR